MNPMTLPFFISTSASIKIKGQDSIVDTATVITGMGRHLKDQERWPVNEVMMPKAITMMASIEHSRDA